MFKLLKSYGLLKFIYKVSRISGFVYTEIEFQENGKVVLKNSFANIIFFVMNIGLTFLSYTFDSRIPILDLTGSLIMEVGVNFITKMTIWFSLPLKLANLVHRQQFFEIIDRLQSNNLQVSTLESFLSFLTNVQAFSCEI